MPETFAATLPFFALILCGYVAAWQGVMGEGSAKMINNFVLYFALPALLVRTLAGLPVGELLQPGFLIAWAAIGAAVFGLTALVAARVMGEGGAAAIIQAAATAHGNVGYLGIALVVSLLGDGVIALVSMAIMVDLVLIITSTIGLLEYFGNRSRPPLAALSSVLRALVFNPFILAIFAGLLLSLADIGIYRGIDDFLRILGTAAVPTALFAIGVSLYGQPMRKAWLGISFLCTMKLLVHPLAMFVVTAFVLGLPRDLVAAATLLAALPTANNVFIIATRFDVRPRLVSGAILVSTAAALVTLNLWAFALSS